VHRVARSDEQQHYDLAVHHEVHRVARSDEQQHYDDVVWVEN
jgi:hypothetical protein